MPTNDLSQNTGRRGFLGSLAAGAATLGIANLAAPLKSFAGTPTPVNNMADPDAWFSSLDLKKHKIVYDSPHQNGIFAFAWPRVFLLTNAATGTPEKDCGVVVVLRHDSIPFAMEDRLWEKYKFGETFKVNDAAGKPATKNAFWKPAAGTYNVPGFGVIQIGINELQASGVMFCVCDAALTVYSAALAQGMGKDAAEVKKDWVSGVLPGIQIVPSGVWALGRAQEKGCGYIFAG